MLDNPTQDMTRILPKHALKWEVHGTEVSIKLKEKSVPGLIQDLVTNQIGFHGLTINRASLEEYFFKEKTPGVENAA